jgi:hypothetical protein
MMGFRTISLWSSAALLLACGGCGGEASIPIPDDAQGTVEAVVRGLNENKPDVLWDALPASYQEDVSSLVHEFATKVDAEIYDQVFRILAKTVDLLGDKKQFILGSQMTSTVVDRAQMEANWDSVVSMFEILVKSELSRAASLKSVDVPAVLRGTGRRFMERLVALSELAPKDPFAALRAAAVEQISSTADITTMRVSMPGQRPEPIRLTRVEGRWVPVEMAQSWSRAVAEARKSLTKMSMNEQGKAQARMSLAMAESVVDRLAAADTQEQFDQVIVGLVGMFMGMPPAGGASPGRVR